MASSSVTDIVNCSTEVVNLHRINNVAQQIRLIDKILLMMKKLTPVEGDIAVNQIMTNLFPILWDPKTDSKLVRKILRVIVAAETLDKVTVTSFLREEQYQPWQLNCPETAMSTWCSLLEMSCVAKQLMKYHLTSMLNRINILLQTHLEGSGDTAWTIVRQKHLHMVIKWVLQLLQHMPTSMEALFTQENVSEDKAEKVPEMPNLNENSQSTGQHALFTNQEYFEFILQKLLNILFSKGYPVDCTLLVGMTVGFFIGLAPSNVNLTQTIVDLLTQRHESEGDIRLHFGEIKLRAVLTSHQLTFGHLALINGIICCAGENVLNQPLRITNSPSLGVWMYQKIHLLCSTSDFQFHGFKILVVWFRAMSVTSKQGIIKLFHTHHKEQCELKDQILSLIWTHLDSHVEGVNENVIESFEIMLSIWHREITTPLHLEEPPSAEGLLDNKHSSWLNSLVSQILQVSWQVKGKYNLLATVVKYMDFDQLRCLSEGLEQHLLGCMSINYMCSAGTHLYKAVAAHGHALDNNHGWQKLCQSWVTRGSLANDILLRQNISQHWLQWTVKTISGSYNIMLNELQKREEANSLQAQMSLLKAARNQQLLHDLPVDVIQQGIFSPDEYIRLDAFGVICVTLRTAEPVTDVEVNLLKSSLPHCLTSDSPPFRQQLQSYLRTLFVRFRDSSLAIFKKKDSSKDCYVKSYIDFIDWLWKLCLDNLYPGACFQRLKMCLDLALNLLEATIHSPSEIHKKKGKVPVASIELVKIAHSYNQWQFFTMGYKSTIMACLLHGTDEVREVAFTILERHFTLHIQSGVDDSLQKHNIHELMKTALNLCNSPRARDCESGAMLIKLVYKSYLLPGPLMIVAENEAELEFVITSDSAKADLCFYQYLVGHLEKSLHCAKQDVLHGATNNPGHGFVLALRQCLCTRDHPPRLYSLWRPIFDKLVMLADRLMSQVLLVLGGNLHNDETAPSFEQMNVAIMSIVTSGAAHLPSDEMDEDTTNLSPQHQMVMTWCWLNIREYSLLLGSLLDCMFIDNTGANELMEADKISAIFYNVLTKCRHKGAIEGCNLGFGRFCWSLLKSPIEKFHTIPYIILKQVLEQVTSQEAVSATRRSAGLPLIVQSIIASESKLRQTRLLSFAISGLLDILKLPIPDDPDQRVDLPHAHALHILKAIFREASVAMAALPYLGEATIHTIKGFSSPVWAIRNASTQLFGTLVARLVSQQKTKDGYIYSTTVSEFFAHHPSLREFFLEEVEKAADDQAILALHPALCPVLAILARLSPGTDSQSNSQISAFKGPLVTLAESSIYNVRELAAQALVPMIKCEYWCKMLDDLIVKLCSTLCRGRHNMQHGTLLQVHQLVKAISPSQGEALTIFEKLHGAKWIPRESKCLVLKSKYFQVMNDLVCRIGRGAPHYGLQQLLDDSHNITYTAEQDVSQNIRIGEAIEIKQRVYMSLQCSLYYESETLQNKLHEYLSSKDTSQQLASIQWLAQHKEDVTTLPLCMEGLQTLLLAMWQHRDWDVRCEGLQLLISLHHTDNQDLLTHSPHLLSKLLQELQESSHSRPRALLLELSAFVVKSTPWELLQNKDNLADKWARLVRTCSEPDCPPLLRQHTAAALQIAGSYLWQNSLSSKDPLFDSTEIIHSLFCAARNLLVDEDTEMRALTVKFVWQLPWKPEAFDKLRSINNSLALDVLHSNLSEAISCHKDLIKKLFSISVSQIPTSSTLEQALTSMEEIDVMFEAQELNPFCEPVVLHQFITTCLLHHASDDGEWWRRRLVELCDQMTSVVDLLNARKVIVLGFGYHKVLYEMVISLVAYSRVAVRHCGDSSTHPQLKQIYRQLLQVPHLHPSLVKYISKYT